MTSPESTCCAIVGAGIGGINAALWLRDLGVPFEWFERAHVGGILRRVSNPLENVSGHIYPAGGAALVQAHIDQLRTLGDVWPHQASVEHIELDPAGATLSFAQRPPLHARFVILATGTRYRELDVQGEDGPWVARSVSAGASAVAGKEVAIVGGGDAALEGALILARHGCTVHLLCRSAPVGARPSFVQEAHAHPLITCWPIPTTVDAIEHREHGAHVHLTTQGRAQQLDVHMLFIRIGVEPTMPPLSTTPTLNTRGHIVVDNDQRTSLERLFAVGDLSAHPLQAVVKAAGDGARAAHAVARCSGYVGVHDA